MPWTAIFFLIGAISISALPPSNGFVSEWLIFQSLFLSFQIPDLLMKIFLPIGAAMLALVPVFLYGDVRARLRVRIEEIFESISIITKICREIPEGPFLAEPVNTPQSG